MRYNIPLIVLLAFSAKPVIKPGENNTRSPPRLAIETADKGRGGGEGGI